jgi:hypothetical protein
LSYQCSLSFWLSHQYPACVLLPHSCYMPCIFRRIKGTKSMELVLLENLTVAQLLRCFMEFGGLFPCLISSHSERDESNPQRPILLL